MLNYLCRFDLIAPSGNVRRGRGRRRKFLYRDLVLLRVMAHLLTRGISVLRLRKALVKLQSQKDSAKDLLTKRYVATDGVELYVADNGVWRAISSGQASFAFVLQLEEVRQEVLNRATQFASQRPGGNTNTQHLRLRKANRG
jgi:DNA-binding transcriptional MerR regulator